MDNILSQLFRGAYVGGAHPYNPKSAVEIAYAEANDQEAAFKQNLPAHLIPEFEKLISSYEKRNFLVSEQDFISGFQLAVQLLIEGIRNINPL